MSQKQKTINIIGSGIAGISTAIRLASNGFKVNVFEKNNTPGGKINRYQSHGYNFDGGIKSISLSKLFTNINDECQIFNSDLFQLEKLEKSCKFFFPDGTSVDFYTDIEQLKTELYFKLKEKTERIGKYFKSAENIYNIAAELYIFNAIDDLNVMISKDARKAMTQLHKADALRSMHDANKACFTKPKTVQIFDHLASYKGSSPYKTPATFKVIAHIDHQMGTYYPPKGMYSIVETLVDIAKDKGVTFFFNHMVDNVLLDQNKVIGVISNGVTYPSDYVVNNMDINNFYTKILKRKVPKKIIQDEPSMSALIFYWGINKKTKNTDLNNVIFASNLQDEYTSIFDKKKLYNDPTITIHISSKKVKDDAPTDCENWVVYINVPSNGNIDWEKSTPVMRKIVIEKINRILNLNIEKEMECEKITTPLDIEKATFSNNGSIYGNSINNLLTAFIRPGNVSRKYQSLFHVGGSVHPGGGIPLCLASAQIVSEKIIKNNIN